MEIFKIETERVLRIGEALGRGDGDLSSCLSPDLKHVCEILGRVAVLQDLAPGFLDEVFHLWIPHFIKMRNKEKIGTVAQSKADAAGFGNEWQAVVEAGNSPHQKDYMALLVDLQIKLTGCNQAQAIKNIAKQIDPGDERRGGAEDSLRRNVTRSKSRKK